MALADPERSRLTASWLFAVAGLVVLMILVGGGTRLTDSGLSITEWRPVAGAIPPLSDAQWAAEFELYRATPEYRQVNAGMSLSAFQTIYWWEWAHRLLGRIVGAAFLLPLVALVALKRLPRRLLWPCVGLFVLGGLQGAVGWWMVASGLTERTDVLPERLTAHLGLALVLLSALIWTALEAWAGPSRRGAPPARGWALLLLGAVLGQCLLGGLVAGNDAGRIYTDWPLMAGQLFPPDYARETLWSTLAHSVAAVQFHHRLGAYAVLAATAAFAVWAHRRQEPVAGAATVLLLVILGQAALGVATLMQASPIGLSLLHQAGAVVALCVATWTAWSSGRPVQAPRTAPQGPVMASVMPGA